MTQRFCAKGTAVALAIALTCLATSAVAAPRDNMQDDLITVTGTADVKTTPDTANIRLGVGTDAVLAADAISETSTLMSKVVAAVKGLGIADADIQTSNLSLEPSYEYPQNQSPRIKGYRATNVASIEIHDLSKVGPVLDAGFRIAVTR